MSIDGLIQAFNGELWASGRTHFADLGIRFELPRAAILPSWFGPYCTNCATYGGHSHGCVHGDADPAPVTERLPEARCECGGAASGCGTHSTWCPAR